MKKIGFWEWDASGLPNYEYTGGYPVTAFDKEGKDSRLPDDPCFILGNYRMTLFAHASGKYELFSGEHGWARLNHCKLGSGWNQAKIRVEYAGEYGKEYELVGEQAQNVLKKQTFGVGYADYQYVLPQKVTVTRKMSVQPSMEIHTGNAAVLTEIILENNGEDAVNIHYSEELLAAYQMITWQEEEKTEKQKIRYKNRLYTDVQQETVYAEISCEVLKFLNLPESPEQSFTHDVYPPLLFMRAVPSEEYRVKAGAENGAIGDILCGNFEVVLNPGEKKTLILVTGFSFEKTVDAAERQIQDMLVKYNAAEETGAYQKQWQKRVPHFTEETDQQLQAEMIWNAYILEAMATYHHYFKETFVPQGSVYAYRLGQNVTVRDHMQHALPLIYTNPSLAKSCIRFTIKHTMQDGEIRRQDIGYGYCDPMIYKESDAQLYVFMTVGEYLRVTGDYKFLEETVSGYPMDTGKSKTVFQYLAMYFVFLRDVIGIGRHGLIKMHNSDWSDSFFHPYSPNIYAQFAESHMNTTMALAVLPVLIRELKEYAELYSCEKEKVDALVSEMEEYRSDLYGAFMKDMEGRTYAPRCYIGEDENPELKFGIDTLCLEAQPFILQMEDFPHERKVRLIEEIKSRVLDMEKIGARTREIPLWSSSGCGEDGGIWFSHQGQLVIGLAAVDKTEAKKLMKKLSFHNYAEVYPEYWLGHWTFADSLESTLSTREGLYHMWVSDPFQPFCAHVHAWMLYDYYKIYGKNK